MMKLRDLLVISTGNLMRMKLRAYLTMSGVIIAITAFVAMLSFGAGNQSNVEREFEKLGLFTTMQVYPKNSSDTSASPHLDNDAIARLAEIPGVRLAYPYDALSVRVQSGDSTAESRAQALPVSAVRTKIFSNLLAGRTFTSDSAKEVIISLKMSRQMGFASPDSALGRHLVVSIFASVIDSGFARVAGPRGRLLRERLEHINFDSLWNASYRSRVVRSEIRGLLRRFADGFMNARKPVRDTLMICGVRENASGGRLKIEPLILPLASATRFNNAGFSGTPAEIFARIQSGAWLSPSGDNDGKTYSQVTLDFDPKVQYTLLRDSVEHMGFRTFSFVEQFQEIQKFFFYFDLALGVIGIIALVTASLGIINTMVMSVSERRKEIGILKSLGADEGYIRGLFLVESGVIGTFGTLGGIAFGWGITRIVSAIARSYMMKEGIPEIELFDLPEWLVLISLALGIGVSVIAGIYPAARAARVDPVEALRND